MTMLEEIYIIEKHPRILRCDSRSAFLTPFTPLHTASNASNPAWTFSLQSFLNSALTLDEWGPQIVGRSAGFGSVLEKLSAAIPQAWEHIQCVLDSCEKT